MAPSWLPLCKSMQRYCEPFFAAIESWRTYEDRDLLMNRILMVETACKIFREFSENTDTYFFDVNFEHEEVPLLPEVISSAGRTFVIGGDVQAFETAKKKVEENVFVKAGVFFQNNLLKAMAGWNAEILAASNIQTRKSIIASVEKLLRLPPAAGVAKFTYKLVDPNTNINNDTIIDFPFPVLSDPGRVFYDFLIEIKKDGQKAMKKRVLESNVRNESSKKKSKGGARGNNKKSVGDDDEEEWPDWLTKHASIGTEVAAYFPSGSSQKVFTGEVVKYLPPTDQRISDQLYHVVWEDGDEQDYDEKELQAGVELFDTLNGWVKDHESVGTKVAAEFSSGSGKKVTTKEFKGIVIKFAPATAESEALYHVVWEDGDEQDYDQGELDAGRARYHAILERAAAQQKLKQLEQQQQALSSVVEIKQQPTSSAAEFAAPSAEKSEPAVSPATEGITEVVPEAVTEDVPMEVVNEHSETASNLAQVSTAEASSSKPATSGKRGGRPSAGGAKTAKKKSSDEPEWTKKHESVGTKVAAYFPCSANDPDGVVLPASNAGKSSANRNAGRRGGSQKKVKPFVGRVVRFAHPSGPGESDQLYHVLWEDGDEEDYDQSELDAGLQLLASLQQPIHNLLSGASTSNNQSPPSKSDSKKSGNTSSSSSSSSAKKSRTTASSPESVEVTSPSTIAVEQSVPVEMQEPQLVVSAQSELPVAEVVSSSVSAEAVAELEARITADDQRFNETHDISNVNAEYLTAHSSIAAASWQVGEDQLQEMIGFDAEEVGGAENDTENNRDGLDEEDI